MKRFVMTPSPAPAGLARRPRISGFLLALTLVSAPAYAPASAQGTAAAEQSLRPVTVAEAVSAALANGARVAVGRADTAVARAQLAIAGALPNPVLAGSYTRSAPQLHATIDLPFDLPYLRNVRVRGARAARRAADLRFELTRAEVRYDVDTAYAAGLAARSRAELSAESARNGDSLLTLVRQQRDAGYASELDVELAQINAGQQLNVAETDSLAATQALLTLQNLMGLPAERPSIALADSLDTLIAAARGLTERQALRGSPAVATLLPVAAAGAEFESRDLALRLSRRRGALVPALQFGVEGRDPTGGPKGLLPIIGLSIPLPLFNRYGGEIAYAEAGRRRAAAELDAARRDAGAAIAAAQREIAQAQRRLDRERSLLQTARDVARKALIAYHEGASALPAVLQAQQSARDTFAQYISDALAVAKAAAAIRLSTATQ